MGDNADRQLQSEALFLYYCQMGKCMYCGRKIHLSELKTSTYNIDHIWPRRFVKDDSIWNNKVLVHSEENAAKGDIYPISEKVRSGMRGFWDYLHNTRYGDARLLNDEKYRRLTRSHPFTDSERNIFINRQLVETRQSSKAVAELLKSRYPDTEIVYVKAGWVSDFRHEYGEIKKKALGLNLSSEEMDDMQLVKSRAVNDLHHAKDAYLNIVVGNVYYERLTKKYYLSKNTNYDYTLNYKVLFGEKYTNTPEVWAPTVHLPIVDKVMSNNNIHLTKYEYIRKGGLFDQMPLKAAEGLIERKKGLDTAKYGGYNKSTVTFFTLVSYKKGKKKELTLVSVDLHDEESYWRDKAAYVMKDDKLGSKVSDVSFPLGERVVKLNTMFSLDGFCIYISGKSNKQLIMRSATSLSLDNTKIRYIKKLEKFEERRRQNKDYLINEKYDKITKEKNIELYGILADKVINNTFMKLPGNPYKTVVEGKGIFESLSVEEQSMCLLNVLSILKTNRAGGCNLTSINGSAESGMVLLSANISNWKYSDVRIIDRSASGLFESVSGNLKDLL